jgi:8-oxo-dGTP diphosphatase
MEKFTENEALAVVLQVREDRLQVLLWQRAREPYLDAWALPGGTLSAAETLEESIRRHLAAKVDVRELAHLEQLETCSAPDRHPDRRAIATAYLGLVPAGVDPRIPADTAWHAVGELPEMAFDHADILERVRKHVGGKKR